LRRRGRDRGIVIHQEARQQLSPVTFMAARTTRSDPDTRILPQRLKSAVPTRVPVYIRRSGALSWRSQHGRSLDSRTSDNLVDPPFNNSADCLLPRILSAGVATIPQVEYSLKISYRRDVELARRHAPTIPPRIYGVAREERKK
jgi:hypothetical protein